MCVSVYTAHPDSDDQPWQFFARHRAHYKKIEGQSIMLPSLINITANTAAVDVTVFLQYNNMTVCYFVAYTNADLMFGVKLDSNAPRLLSVSTDKTIVSLLTNSNFSSV